MNNMQIQTLYSKTDVMNRLLETENIYIYGAGRIAKNIIVFLKEHGLYNKVVSLLVTDTECNPNKYVGKNVCSYDDVNIEKKNLIIVAINLCSVLDVIELLKNNSYTKIALLSSKLIDEFLHEKNIYYISNVLRFNVALTEHCNLNCRNCPTFSPVASEKFIDIIECEKDLNKLSELFDSECDSIHLVGGEPLLHPALKCIIEGIRKKFYIGKIKLFSNGMILNDIDESLWKIFHEYDVEIILNKYIAKCRDDILKEKANIYDVRYKVIDYTNPSVSEKNYSYGISEQHLLDIDGQFAEFNFSYCPFTTQFPQLKNGKLYKCSVPANISHINEYYKLDFHVSELDYIDIYKAKDAKDILERLYRPLPFCRYCRTQKTVYDIPWSESKKGKKEWMVE